MAASASADAPLRAANVSGVALIEQPGKTTSDTSIADEVVAALSGDAKTSKGTHIEPEKMARPRIGGRPSGPSPNDALGPA